MVVIAYMHVRVAADVVYNAAANITDQFVINVAILLQHLINVYFVLLLCVAYLFSRQHICIGDFVRPQLLAAETVALWRGHPAGRG
jgi:hypothetical protein